MNHIKFTIIFVLLLVFVTPLLLIFGIRFIPEGEITSLKQEVKVYGSEKIGIYFSSDRKNLKGFYAMVKNPSLINKKDLKLSVFDSSGLLVRESIVNGAVIPDGEIVKFIFPVIVNSANQRFDIEFSSPDSSDDEALSIFLGNNNYQTALIPLFKESRVEIIKSVLSDCLEKF